MLLFGISDELLLNPECKYCVKIPLKGPVESLNLAASAAIISYELTRL